jgi:hypothetical protein
MLVRGVGIREALVESAVKRWAWHELARVVHQEMVEVGRAS